MPIQQELPSDNVPIKIWTNDFDEKSKQQLSNIAGLPFIHSHVAAMPDVHLGMGATVGSVIATDLLPVHVPINLPRVRMRKRCG